MDVLVLQGKSKGSLTPSSFYSVVNCTESEDFVELVNAKDICKSPIEGACLEDVIIEEGNDFLIRKTRGDQEPEHLSLKEIKRISIQDIKVAALRAFCVKVQVIDQYSAILKHECKRAQRKAAQDKKCKAKGKAKASNNSSSEESDDMSVHVMNPEEVINPVWMA